MYAVVRERILSCGTRLRATLLTEHIHGQTGEPFFIGGNQVGAPARAASPPPSAPRAVQDHETGALIPSCLLRTRGRDVAAAPSHGQRWLAANDFSGAAVRVEVAGRPGASWTSGEIAARITPLSSRTGRLSLVLRPRAPRFRRRPGPGGGPHGRAQWEAREVDSKWLGAQSQLDASKAEREAAGLAHPATDGTPPADRLVETAPAGPSGSQSGPRAQQRRSWLLTVLNEEDELEEGEEAPLLRSAGCTL
eukprot:tig00000449_g942.t1